MKTLTKITALFLLLISTTSCFMDGITGIKGNRNVVSEDRTISSDFENIKVQQGINLYITQDNSTEIKVEADENIIDLLITEVQNNGTSSSWGASPGSITKGSTTSTGATHSGQTVYRTALTFTSTGTYLRNYVVTEIMFGANRYYSSANTQAQIDALSNLGGKYHFKTISLAEGRGYFAS